MNTSKPQRESSSKMLALNESSFDTPLLNIETSYRLMLLYHKRKINAIRHLSFQKRQIYTMKYVYPIVICTSGEKTMTQQIDTENEY